jgi:hypothetical protein
MKGKMRDSTKEDFLRYRQSAVHGTLRTRKTPDGLDGMRMVLKSRNSRLGMLFLQAGSQNNHT